MSECLEHLQGLHWFTAQASNGSGACGGGVPGEGSVAVRDSKDRDIGPFVVGGQGWSCFVQKRRGGH
ncbi:DUF397 domain-containing protein [Streptomyces sp. KL116D]|uniref:DUF397 domain-containing protein n=1 Tax=Streptomyces sp. KL116D TaxID=3045152 RepID=UPI0035576BCB